MGPPNFGYGLVGSAGSPQGEKIDPLVIVQAGIEPSPGVESKAIAGSAERGGLGLDQAKDLSVRKEIPLCRSRKTERPRGTEPEREDFQCFPGGKEFLVEDFRCNSDRHEFDEAEFETLVPCEAEEIMQCASVCGAKKDRVDPDLPESGTLGRLEPLQDRLESVDAAETAEHARVERVKAHVQGIKSCGSELLCLTTQEQAIGRGDEECAREAAPDFFHKDRKTRSKERVSAGDAKLVDRQGGSDEIQKTKDFVIGKSRIAHHPLFTRLGTAVGAPKIAPFRHGQAQVQRMEVIQVRKGIMVLLRHETPVLPIPG